MATPTLGFSRPRSHLQLMKSDMEHQAVLEQSPTRQVGASARHKSAGLHRLPLTSRSNPYPNTTAPGQVTPQKAANNIAPSPLHHLPETEKSAYTWADAPTVLTVYHWRKDAKDIRLGESIAGVEANGETFKLESAEQRSCRLCAKQYVKDEMIVPLPCGHRFHKKCVEPRLAEWFGCPECGVEMVWVMAVKT